MRIAAPDCNPRRYAGFARQRGIAQRPNPSIGPKPKPTLTERKKTDCDGRFRPRPGSCPIRPAGLRSVGIMRIRRQFWHFDRHNRTRFSALIWG